MDKTPSFFRIIAGDFIAAFSILIPVMMWIMSAAVYFSPHFDQNDINFVIITAGVTIIAIGLIIWRVSLINAVFADGYEISATITNLSFYRDRGRIEYFYTYEGRKILSGTPVMKGKKVNMMKVGDTITVLVDRGHPKRVFIKELFTK